MKGAIWARVSTSGQAETSLPSQTDRCRAKLEELGYSVAHAFAVDWTSTDLYSCPQFQELRRLITKKEIDALAVFDRDRLEQRDFRGLPFLLSVRNLMLNLSFAKVRLSWMNPKAN